MRLLTIYQLVGPLLLVPLSYWGWFQREQGDALKAVAIASMPVLYAYVVPFVGANVLRLWEIRTRFRVGRIRPHNGFVFGSAIGLITLLISEPASPQPADLARAAFTTGATLGFLLWIYDIYAIRHGVLVVYTKHYADNLGPEAIATGYAPLMFFVFGVIYSTALRAIELLPGDPGSLALPIVLGSAALLLGPAATYVLVSFLRTGESGLRPYHNEGA